MKNAPVYDYYEAERRRHRPLPAAARICRHPLSSMPAFSSARRRNGPSLTANACPRIRKARANRSSSISFPRSRFTTISKSCFSTDSLTDLATRFRPNDPLVQKVLAGKVAGSARRGTGHRHEAKRSRLPQTNVRGRQRGDQSGERSRCSRSPLLIDRPARAARKVFDTNDEAKQQAYAQIAKARFALEGTSTYPDATFTLRLSYGTVRGYEENGKQVPAFTDFAGLYARSAEHENKEPFDLPPRWIERKDKLSLGTRFNFVCDADIIGGNSGSPVVNQAGQFVGIIFDGNIQSLVLDYVYDDKQARAVSVDSAAIIEALRKNLRCQARWSMSCAHSPRRQTA